MKNLVLRTVTGILFVAVVVASILLHDVTEVPFYALMLLVAVLGTWEFLKMAQVLHRWFQTIVTLLSIASISVAPMMIIRFEWLGAFFCCIPFLFFFIVLFAIELFRKEEGSSRLQAVSMYILPFFWIGIPVFMMGLMISVYMPRVLALLVIIWLNDTLAYCAGSLFGRHKLCERISPKKTWEGFVIALVLTVAASVSFSYIAIVTKWGLVFWKERT